VEVARPRGRPKKTWREIVEKDCQARGLKRNDAMDHNRCKWVNVSSGASSPGLSPRKSIEL